MKKLCARAAKDEKVMRWNGGDCYMKYIFSGLYESLNQPHSPEALENNRKHS